LVIFDLKAHSVTVSVISIDDKMILSILIRVTTYNSWLNPVVKAEPPAKAKKQSDSKQAKEKPRL